VTTLSRRRHRIKAGLQRTPSHQDRPEGFKPEVMIPLVGHVEELKRQKAIVLEAAHEVLGKDNKQVEFAIGAMIEVPRGALTADEIASSFSFPNGLTHIG
jgi:phosphoenolpyruvate synthase/pyruvate phosphate dikinase